jgi:uncharacterized membrane protein
MKYVDLFKKEVLNWLFILAPLIYLFVVRDRLPEFSLIKFDPEHSIYQVIFFIMFVGLIFYLKLSFWPFITPRAPIHDNLRTLYRFKTIMLGYISFLCISFVSARIGISFNWDKIAMMIAMIFLIFLGNLYPTIRYNYFFGLRNSWTLSNEYIWKKTHKLSGRICFWTGIAGMLIQLFFEVSRQFNMYAMLIFIWGNFFGMRLYSYYLFGKYRTQDQVKNIE